MEMLLYGSALLLMVLGPTKLRETRIIFKSTVAILYNRGFCRKIVFLAAFIEMYRIRKIEIKETRSFCSVRSGTKYEASAIIKRPSIPVKLDSQPHKKKREDQMPC